MINRYTATIAILLPFVCWVIIAPKLAEHLKVDRPLAKADLIVVLGGSASYPERTLEAAALFQGGTAQNVLLTDDGMQGGWNAELKRNPYFVERAKWELIRHGVPERSIEILPTIVKGTYDESDLILTTAAKRGIRSIVLVTSQYHSRRALWTFERTRSKKRLENIQIGILTPALDAKVPSNFRWWLTGSGWNTIGVEYLKLAYYWLRY